MILCCTYVALVTHVATHVVTNVTTNVVTHVALATHVVTLLSALPLVFFFNHYLLFRMQ